MSDYLTFGEMKDQVAREIQDASSTRRPTIVGDALNRVYQEAARRFRWPSLSRAREKAVTAVADESFLYLDKDVAQLYFLRNGDLGTEVIHQAIESFFRRQGLELDNGGTIWTYSDAGESGKKADIDSAEALTISSSSASADNGKAVLVHGIVSGDELFESVTLPGAGGINTSNSFSEIYAVSIDGSQSGVITVTGNTSGTEYATIAPGERTAKYRKIRLGMTPSSGTTITYYYKKRTPLLARDDQVPEIPASSALVELAAARQMTQTRNLPAAQQRMASANEMLQLAYDSVRQSDSILQATPYDIRPARGRGGRTGFVVVNNG